MTRCATVALGLLLLPGGAAVSGESTAFVVSFDINKELWETSDWTEPPQLAVWLENETTGDVRTLFVTYRTGHDDWKGKPSCPPSLPHWVTRFQKEFGRDRGPTTEDPAPDAVTGATPKTSFSHPFEVGEGAWSLYIEVNVSGDYNEHYKKVSRGARFADFGNGQPSLVYRAEDITGDDGAQFALIGMTVPAWSPEDMLVEPMHITSADRLLQGLTLTRAKP